MEKTKILCTIILFISTTIVYTLDLGTYHYFYGSSSLFLIFSMTVVIMVANSMICLIAVLYTDLKTIKLNKYLIVFSLTFPILFIISIIIIFIDIIGSDIFSLFFGLSLPKKILLLLMIFCYAISSFYIFIIHFYIETDEKNSNNEEENKKKQTIVYGTNPEFSQFNAQKPKDYNMNYDINFQNYDNRPRYDISNNIKNNSYVDEFLSINIKQ